MCCNPCFIRSSDNRPTSGSWWCGATKKYRYTRVEHENRAEKLFVTGHQPSIRIWAGSKLFNIVSYAYSLMHFCVYMTVPALSLVLLLFRGGTQTVRVSNEFFGNSSLLTLPK